MNTAVIIIGAVCYSVGLIILGMCLAFWCDESVNQKFRDRDESVIILEALIQKSERNLANNNSNLCNNIQNNMQDKLASIKTSLEDSSSKLDKINESLSRDKTTCSNPFVEMVVKKTGVPAGTKRGPYRRRSVMPVEIKKDIKPEVVINITEVTKEN